MNIQGSTYKNYVDSFIAEKNAKQSSRKARLNATRNYYMEEYGVNSVKYDDYGFKKEEET